MILFASFLNGRKVKLLQHIKPDQNSTNLTPVQLENSTHGDAGATNDVVLNWMVDEAARTDVKMQPVERNWVIK